jgi:hypothetical protein
LFFASMVAASSRRRPKESAPPPPFPPPGTSPAPEAAGPCRQPELFTLPFEAAAWRILADDWPRLGWYEHLMPAVARIGQRHGWSQDVQDHVRSTLQSLIATQPSDARIYPASAVQRLAAGPHHSAARTLELLADLQLLAEDRPGPDDIWAGKRLARLPAGICQDVQPWLDQIRLGDARHRPKAAGTWRAYCTEIMPVLLAWAPHHDTLRDITRDDIITALTEPRPHGGDNHTRAIALRSLFRLLNSPRLSGPSHIERCAGYVAWLRAGARDSPAIFGPDRRLADSARVAAACRASEAGEGNVGIAGARHLRGSLFLHRRLVRVKNQPGCVKVDSQLSDVGNVLVNTGVFADPQPHPPAVDPQHHSSIAGEEPRGLIIAQVRLPVGSRDTAGANQQRADVNLAGTACDRGAHQRDGTSASASLGDDGHRPVIQPNRVGIEFVPGQ